VTQKAKHKLGSLFYTGTRKANKRQVNVIEQYELSDKRSANDRQQMIV
jgi:hypothetical protein